MKPNSKEHHAVCRYIVRRLSTFKYHPTGANPPVGTVHVEFKPAAIKSEDEREKAFNAISQYLTMQLGQGMFAWAPPQKIGDSDEFDYLPDGTLEGVQKGVRRVASDLKKTKQHLLALKKG